MNRIFSQGVAHGFAPAAPAVIDPVAGGSGSLGIQPPALFGHKTIPVGEGGGNEGWIGFFDRPSQQNQLLAQLAPYQVMTGAPVAARRRLLGDEE